MEFAYLCNFMLRKAFILAVFLLLGALPVSAQYVLNGSAPASVQWNRIRGEHFDMIFPVELDSLAREYLYSFEKTRTATLTGLHIDTPRMPILLQPYQMNSNGMVVWAPRRLELYTTPDSNPLYALNWEMQLATHEGRHIGQMTHYTKGIYRVLNLIAGEQGSAVGIGLYPSRVLLEGDAVQNETDLTGAGRGRDPEFLKFFRASFLVGDFRTWADWRYGSFRRYTPGKYQLGYLMVSTMRSNSGNYFATGDIMSTQVRDWWRFFSVSHRAYIHATGLTGRKNWRSAIARNTEIWRWEYNLRAPYTPFTPLLAEREPVYTEISNPVHLDDGVYATMNGMQFEPRIVRIDSLGRKHYRRSLSALSSTLVADSDHSLLFSEIVPDPRWEQRSWSVIRRYDAETNRYKTLTRHTRYVNPAPSAGRDSILAVEYPVAGGSRVVILDRDGNYIDGIDAPEHGQITHVAELANGLYASVVTTEGIGIFHYDGSWHRIVDPQLRMIRELRAANDKLLYFISDLDGLSNLYTLDPATRQLMRISSTRVGTATPSLDKDGTLYYGEYDHLGYQPVSTSFKDLPRKNAFFHLPYVNKIAEHNAAQVAEHVVPRTAEEDSLLRRQIDSLESRRYSKILHGFHIHSWAPVYANVDRLMNDIGGFDLTNFSNWYEYVAPGVTLISQNHLGTLVSVLGYSYHDHHHGAHAYFSYSGLYPKFDLAVDFNNRSQTHSEYQYSPDEGLIVQTDTLARPGLNINAAMYVPLDFSRGGWFTTLTPRLNYVATNDSFRLLDDDAALDVDKRYTHALIATLRFDTRLGRPTARLTPRLGFGAQLSGQMRLGPKIENTTSYGFNAWMFLPGFGKEDGFKLSYARQFQPWGAYKYTGDYNLVKMPYGYRREPLINYHRGTLEYALPIYAGDIDGGFFFYLKRFMLVPFVDYAIDKWHINPVKDGYNPPSYHAELGPKHYFSYGSAVMVTTRLFRIGTDFKFGVRASFMPDGGSRFQFIMSTGL